MGKKITYRATFANGQTFTRKSHRAYVVAWTFERQTSPEFAGQLCTPSYSSSYELAVKAAVARLKYTGPRNVQFVAVEVDP